MKRFVPVLSVILIFFVFIACGKQEEPKEAAEAKTYDVLGMVVAVDHENNTVTIAHEDIPDLMSAMTMSFQVKDAALLEMVQPADSVHFEITVDEGEMWISDIQKTE